MKELVTRKEVEELMNKRYVEMPSLKDRIERLEQNEQKRFDRWFWLWLLVIFSLTFLFIGFVIGSKLHGVIH